MPNDYPGYPATVAEIIQNRTYKPAILQAMRLFRRTKAYRGTQQEREVKFNALHAAFCAAYAKQTRLVIDQAAANARVMAVINGGSVNSCFDANTDTIYLTGFSVITYLHEFAHALGKDENGACVWSVNLFRRIFPHSFERCQFDGHVVIQTDPHCVNGIRSSAPAQALGVAVPAGTQIVRAAETVPLTAQAPAVPPPTVPLTCPPVNPPQSRSIGRETLMQQMARIRRSSTAPNAAAAPVSGVQAALAALTAPAIPAPVSGFQAALAALTAPAVPAPANLPSEAQAAPAKSPEAVSAALVGLAALAHPSVPAQAVPAQAIPAITPTVPAPEQLTSVYCWVAMKDGRLMEGPNTRSDFATTAEVAASLAKPALGQNERCALCRIVKGPQGVPTPIILRIEGIPPMPPQPEDDEGHPASPAPPARRVQMAQWESEDDEGHPASPAPATPIPTPPASPAPDPM